MAPDFLQNLYVHMEWADALVWHAARSTEDRPPDAQLHNGLFHLHSTQHAFLDVWSERAVARHKPEQYAALSELQRWARTFYRPAESVLARVTPSSLKDPLRLPWTRYFEKQLGGPAETTSWADTLFQVAAHSTYHRGQINHRIREIGADPPLVDYIAWVWYGRPTANWID